MIADEETEEKTGVHLTSYGAGGLGVKGIPQELQEQVEAVFRSGASWMRVVDGNIELLPAFKATPKPYEDGELLPFWRKASPAEKSVSYTLFDLDKLEDHSSPSIYIQSLCGYYYTAARYKATAEKLESYGFECLRSRRGKDGRYWEVWYLPGLWAAEGELENELAKLKGVEATESQKLKAALEFIRHNVSFGSLSVSVQKLCMVMDD